MLKHACILLLLVVPMRVNINEIIPVGTSSPWRALPRVNQRLIDVRFLKMRHRFIVGRSDRAVEGICVHQGGSIFIGIYAIVAKSKLFLDSCTYTHDVTVQNGLPISEDMFIRRGFPGS